ncbi:MAG: 2-oxoacid:acceptor oxidoreductase family protein [Lachnospiraceae bacterium]|nr:2-oxoacid:acceptor oxidoreductase family protein [Lachnospiraceae bacterium]
MVREIFVIGVGGQGALSIGEIILNAANKKNYGASFYPFYGSQMRGGEAGCIVKIDTDGKDILNPTINSPDDFIILNDKFFDKYEKFKNENSKYYRLDEIDAEKYKDIDIQKNLNIVILKKYIKGSLLFDDEDIIEAIKMKFRKEEVYSKMIKIYKV